VAKKASKSDAPKKQAAKGSATKDTIKLIKSEARTIEGKILDRQKPSLRLPLRALANVKYSVAK